MERLGTLGSTPLVAILVVLAACGPAPLAHSASSPEALAREMLAALERRDDDRLHALALEAGEFERQVWPSLPAARPERNLPWNYVWHDLRQKSDLQLRRTLAVHGGRRYELLGVRFEGDVTQYAAYRVHRAAVFSVRDPHGQMTDLRVCGSLIERAGRWKVFSYVIKD